MSIEKPNREELSYLSNSIAFAQQIREIIANEIRSDEITSIEKDFYLKILNKITELQEKDNLTKLLNILQYVRIVKILGKIFFGLEVDKEKLSKEELELVKYLKSIYARYISEKKVIEITKKEEVIGLALIVFKEPLHKVYLGNLTLGPFSKGDVAVLPLEVLRTIPSDKITVVEVFK